MNDTEWIRYLGKQYFHMIDGHITDFSDGTKIDTQKMKDFLEIIDALIETKEREGGEVNASIVAAADCKTLDGLTSIKLRTGRSAEQLLKVLSRYNVCKNSRWYISESCDSDEIVFRVSGVYVRA